MKAEKIIQEKKSKINELKSKLPNSVAVYSIKIILAISLLFLVALFVSFIFSFFEIYPSKANDAGFRLAGASIFFTLYYFLNKNLPFLKTYYLLNKEIKKLKKDIEVLKLLKF